MKDEALALIDKENVFILVSEFFECNNRFPKPKEIAQELNISVDKARKLLQENMPEIQKIAKSFTHEVLGVHRRAINESDPAKINPRLLTSWYEISGSMPKEEKAGTVKDGVNIQINIVGLEPKKYNIDGEEVVSE